MSNKHGLIKILTVLAYLLVVLKSIIAAGCSEAPDKPNIILIMADDLGYNELGCYGQQKIKTPNIDRLAQEGMLVSEFCTVVQNGLY
jgi:arylsulfatase A